MARGKPSLLLAGHALFMGVGWIPLVVIFGFLVEVHPAENSILAWSQGGLILMGAIFVLPLLWPVFIAIAWFEAGLAERIAVGEERAKTQAVWLLRSFGSIALVIAVAAALAVLSWPNEVWGERQELAHGAWTGPAALAIVHFTIARVISQVAPQNIL